MLAISLVSLAIRQPFTLQYALEVVDAETARLPGFLQRELHHHLGVDRRFAADDDRQYRADLCAGPAAVVRTC